MIGFPWASDGSHAQVGPIPIGYKTFVQDSSQPVLSARDAYVLGFRGDRAELERALETRGADPAGLAIVRASLALLEGDVPGADSFLTRALAQAANESDAGYLADVLVQILSSRNELTRAAAVLERKPPDELRAAHAALLSAVAAQRGDREAALLAYEHAESYLRDVTDPVLRAKIVGRGAITAFYLGRFEVAVERAMYAAASSVKANAPRTAAHNYFLLHLIYREQFGDLDLARFYAMRHTIMATRANDVTLMVHGLAAQIELAAEAGDTRQLGMLRRRLLSLPSGTRFYERLSVVIGELLPAAWSGDFVTCSMKLAALREDNRTDVERMFCEALLALCAYARGFRDEAAAWCASALSRGAERVTAEYHSYRIARIITAHVEIALGRTHGGRRMLQIEALRGAPEEGLASLVSAGSFTEDDAPKWLRGIARALIVADESAKRVAPVTLLTPAEAELLPLMASGKAVKNVAAQLGKRESTVRAQIQAIARKLGTHSLVESISEARRKGLL